MDFGKPKALKLPKYELNPHKYLRVSWSRPKTEWVDPLKDAKAGKEEVDMGINTLTDLCEVAGRDIEEVVATRKYEQKLFKVAGIKLGGEVTEDNTINNEEDNNGGVKDAE